MKNRETKIVKYSERYREEMLEVWESSVRATHYFLKPQDFLAIKELVHQLDFPGLEVHCLLLNNQVIGFIGVVAQKIEMLFLGPEYFGLGLGKKLMHFALSELKATEVDVNEQNANALKFYQKFGFNTYERTEKDDQGNNYPLLRMKLEKA